MSKRVSKKSYYALEKNKLSSNLNSNSIQSKIQKPTKPKYIFSKKKQHFNPAIEEMPEVGVIENNEQLKIPKSYHKRSISSINNCNANIDLIEKEVLIHKPDHFSGKIDFDNLVSQKEIQRSSINSEFMEAEKLNTFNLTNSNFKDLKEFKDIKEIRDVNEKVFSSSYGNEAFTNISKPLFAKNENNANNEITNRNLLKSTNLKKELKSKTKTIVVEENVNRSRLITNKNKGRKIYLL